MPAPSRPPARSDIEAWIAADPDPSTRNELRALLDSREGAELASRFSGPLAFGTAGLRGLMGAGPSRMNRAVIRRTTAGLAAYLLEAFPDARERGVVVGYDGRHLSREFAADTASVLEGAGIRARLFDGPVPTPLVPFAVMELKALAGVMVTASHNPPAYNGYKLYDAHGIQIIAPVDKAVARKIDEAPSVDRIPLGEFHAELGDALVASYLDGIARMPLHPETPRELTIAYTALHGVGGALAKAALARSGFTDLHDVAIQAAPDGDFPTVPFPNPEEKGALDLLLAEARAAKADIAFANDPDADRLAIAVPSNEGWRILSGDEVGALLGDYLISEGPQRSNRLVLSTIVSSSLLRRIAHAAGVRHAETLTGFKWLGNRAIALEQSEGLETLFCYEEAIGYAVGHRHFDKDGLSALLVAADMAAFLKARGETLLDRLEQLYQRHGLVRTRQRSVPTSTFDFMAEFRAQPPTAFGPFRVEAMRDLSLEGALPTSDVLIFELEGGARLIARPSGTEPKIKFYAEVVEPFEAGERAADAKLNALLSAVASETPRNG